MSTPKFLVHDIETVGTELDWDATTAPPTASGDPPCRPSGPCGWSRSACCRSTTTSSPPGRPAAPGRGAGATTEEGMIAAWAKVVTSRGRTAPLTLVDFNGRTFDLPVLQTRAFRYGIELGWFFGLLPDNHGGISQWSKEYRDRYAGLHLDLRDWWTNRGGFAATKLEHLARLMGLPGKLGVDAYCLSDVYQTALVFARIWLTSGKLSRNAYRTAATALLECAASDPSQAELVAAIDRGAVMALELA